MLKLRRLPLGGLLVSLLAVAQAGCSTGMPFWSWVYVKNVVEGELDFLCSAVPIEQGLNDPDLTQEQKNRLAFVIKARDYAEQVVGLKVGGSYRNFVNLHGKTLAWNLTASRSDAIEPYIWDLPVAGPISYLGFFSYDELIAERDWLRSIGYDTFTYEIDAFSTLGLLPDPVSSALLERSLPNLADTIMHELTHNTVWAGQDATFSESMASFVGSTAGMEFLKHEYGSDSPLLVEARHASEDQDAINAFLQQMVVELQALYAQPLSAEEKLALREPIFQAARDRFVAEVQPTLHDPGRYAGYGTFAYNNAFLLVNVRYNSDLQVFADVYEHNNHNWSATLAVFDEAARSSQPYTFLYEYLVAEANQESP